MATAFVIFILLLSIITVIGIFLQHPMFGMNARGERKKKLLNSQYYSGGRFHNLSVTPNFTNGANMFTALSDFLKPHPGRYPQVPMPVIKPNFSELNKNENIIIWFGHSTIYLQLNGISILSDPIFNSGIGPLNSRMKAFRGTEIFKTEDLPDIDYLLITHDHWDHLDYDTVIKLKNKTGKIITGLGTGAHLEYWGFPAEKIIEADWDEKLLETKNLKINSWFARHFSGRGFKRNQNIWLSFIIQTPGMKIYLGGDSGYDEHFKQAGEKFGPFDLAILENGQYNLNWQYIHMMPEEVIEAGKDLKSRHILPVHWGKFSLAFHPWNDPVNRVIAEAEKQNSSLILPQIGEIIYLDKLDEYENTIWWKL